MERKTARGRPAAPAGAVGAPGGGGSQVAVSWMNAAHTCQAPGGPGKGHWMGRGVPGCRKKGVRHTGDEALWWALLGVYVMCVGR